MHSAHRILVITLQGGDWLSNIMLGLPASDLFLMGGPMALSDTFDSEDCESEDGYVQDPDLRKKMFQYQLEVQQSFYHAQYQEAAS